MDASSTLPQTVSHERIRNTLFSFLPKEDLKSVRLASKELSIRAAPVLFADKRITFHQGLFTKPSWLGLLDRLGHHVKSFHFNMPHSNQTSLPPLIDDQGDDVPFIYEPRISPPGRSRDSIPPYGSQEMYDLLTKHYPTIFHAAANVPSFIRVFSRLTHITHLKISTPGQSRSEAYMRSAVDYALISLRIAVERNKMLSLDSLTLDHVHPGASFYLNPLVGFAARPNSLKRWRQVRKLKIVMDTPPTCTLPDHLKMCHHYLQVFAPAVKHFSFQWIGMQAPWPLSLHNEPTPSNSRCETAYSKGSTLDLKELQMPRLRNLYAANVAVDAWQISSFVEHNRELMRRHRLCNLEFKESILRSGTWDEALSPFSRISGSDRWEAAVKAAKKEAKKSSMPEMLEVPLIFHPADWDFDPAESELLQPVRYDPSRPNRSLKASPHLGLLRAGAMAKDLLHGTEEHMREMFRASIFSCWRRGGSVMGVASRCA